jgi:putative ABC transport system permease protein
MGMTFVQGRMSRETNEVVVNETFVEKMGWKDQALDKTIHTERGNKKIVGVLKNFRIGDFYASESLPFIAQFYRSNRSKVHVKLKEPFHENLQRLNQEVGEAFPNRSVVFESLDAEIRQYYQSEYIFRNITMVATVVVLFITLMGLIGFINDETQRRSKEIAIRKVNGADASSIIEMLAKDVLWTALPAVVLGTLASWYVGELWMSQFATVVGSTIPYYIMTGIVTLLMIVGVVVVKTWRIANENPVLSIKSE